jgi:class 3 adenylate cyclase
VDIEAWLHSLRMQQYNQAFRDNAIDAAVLPELTADDLRGPRRKPRRAPPQIVAAIAALRRYLHPAPETEDVASVPERRQLTEMFCALVGSTALAARLDPEDLRDVTAAYHHAIAEVIARFGAYVAIYLGDGVLAYFGYPQAYEDDAERAVRAALAVVEAIHELPISERLQERVGLATGLAVGRRRSDRIGRRAGAGGGGRDAKSRGAPAAARRAWRDSDRRPDPDSYILCLRAFSPAERV